MIHVLGIKIIDRIKEAGLTQGVLSRHHEVIITRLGFHEVTDTVCSREACIVLHLKDDNRATAALAADLKEIGGILVRGISFGDGAKPDYDLTGAPEVLAVVVKRDPTAITELQKILTSFGCNIRTRLGVNEMFFGEPAGLIILELTGDDEQRLLLEKHLMSTGKILTGRMNFGA